MSSAHLDEIMLPGTPMRVQEAYRSLRARSLDALFGLEEEEVVVLDTETTGFSHEHDELIEIAAAIMKGPVVLARFATFVNPQRHIPPAIVKLCGITDDMVKDAPSASAAVRDLAAFVGSRDIIAHNASFDEGFIMRHAQSMGCSRGGSLSGVWIDTVELARIALPRLKAHSLEVLSKAFETTSSEHRATADVEALCGVWRVLLVALSDFPEGLLDRIAQMHPAIDWPLRKILSHIAAASPATHFSLRLCRAANTSEEKLVNKVDASGCGMLFPSAAEVASGFAKDSIVGNMYPGYEPRSEQVAMATEVLAAFEQGTFRAIEAGTGVGKSIAYLLPAALISKRAGIGIGVATKTNALMDQLIYHELPRLSQALGQPLNYVALKGYEHYPCLRKLERLANDDAASNHAALMMLATLYAYIGQTAWGDLDSVNLYWRDLPKEQIVARSGDCVHTHCPFYPKYCLLHGLRQRAKAADIVVTNHALLFRDVMADGGILPPIRHWIIDEAHAVEDEARKQLSPCIDVRNLSAALEMLYHGQASVLANIRRKFVKMDGATVVMAAVVKAEEQARQVDTIAESFFSFVKDLGEIAEKSSYDRTDIWVNPKVRESGPWSVVAGTGRSLVSRLEKLRDLCNEILDVLEASSGELADLRSEVLSLSGRLNEMREALVLVILGEDESYVYEVAINRRPDMKDECLSARLLDVGECLANDFYPRVLSVIYTSATIATGESFDHFTHAVGLDRMPDEMWSTLRLASSYDFDHNMTVFVPSDIPAPNDFGYTEALEQLLLDVHRAMGGSTLTLFTNRREMTSFYKKLKPQMQQEGIKLICQVQGTSSKRLKDEFLEDEKTSLFALRSFWEGFDAPGDTLRCVIIPRLPFTRPNDPLSCERESRDRNAWGHYALPEAIIDLKQAAGRLIRSSTDRGFLVLADSRLVTKSYGKAFLHALPSQNQLILPSDLLCDSIKERIEGQLEE